MLWNGWFIDKFSVYDFGPNRIKICWENIESGKKLTEHRDIREVDFWTNILNLQKKHYMGLNAKEEWQRRKERRGNT